MFWLFSYGQVLMSLSQFNFDSLVNSCPKDTLSVSLCLPFCGVGEACFSLYQIHNQLGLYPQIVKALSMQLFALVNFVHALWKAYDSRRKEKKKKKTTFWLQILSFRLRSVKMEQRKLNDQANTLVDLAKVSLGSQPPYSHLLELTPAEKTVPLQEAAPPKIFNQTGRTYQRDGPA